MTLFSAFDAGAKTSDLDEACRGVQDALGVTDGGLAGVVFSDLEDEGEGSWSALGESDRYARLLAYAQSEIKLLMPEGVDLDDTTISPEDEEAFKAFVGSRKRMRARSFGEMIGDAMWEDEKVLEFLVYDDQWYIEICTDGRHLLVLENRNWITGQDGVLEDLERRLFLFSRTA